MFLNIFLTKIFLIAEFPYCMLSGKAWIRPSGYGLTALNSYNPAQYGAVVFTALRLTNKIGYTVPIHANVPGFSSIICRELRNRSYCIYRVDQTFFLRQ